MSSDSNNSPDAVKSKMTTDLEQLKSELGEKAAFDRLVVLMIGGGEQLVGEFDSSFQPVVDPYSKTVDDPIRIVGTSIQIKNPKRYMRLQKVAANGSAVSVDYFIGALDGIDEDGSVMQVEATAGYWVKHLGVPSQISFLKILNGYFKHRMMNKAMASGLALPSNMGGLSGKG